MYVYRNGCGTPVANAQRLSRVCAPTEQENSCGGASRSVRCFFHWALACCLLRKIVHKRKTLIAFLSLRSSNYVPNHKWVSNYGPHIVECLLFTCAKGFRGSLPGNQFHLCLGRTALNRFYAFRTLGRSRELADSKL